MQNKKIFFLHIPKTAGSAFNNIFKNSVPSTHFSEHLESRSEKLTEVMAAPERCFASGHFTYEQSKQYIDRSDVYSITIVRNPVEQLLSHIKWVKSYGSKERSKDLKNLQSPIVDIAQALWDVPLNNFREIDKIISSSIGMQLFDNVQVRYLTSANVVSVTSEQCNLAISNIKTLNLAFALDDITDAVKLLKKLDPSIKDIQVYNKAKIDEKLDHSNLEAVDYYRQKVRFDARLFIAARQHSRNLYNFTS